MLLVAFAGGALVTWPLMTQLAGTHTMVPAFMLILVGVLFESAYTSISAVVKAELFPTEVRSLGVALPYALANAAFGGTAEYMALWFKSAGIESGFYYYASGLSAVGFLAAAAMKDTRRFSRIVED
jgi:MHS family alpha-ketoglutarate permease-like MFS transporter